MSTETSQRESWKSFVVEIIIVLIIVLGIRFYVFQFFRVSGPSMCPTLNYLNEECLNGKGEFIFVNKLLYLYSEPQRGEIVILHPPNNDEYYIKRVIATPGDEVQIERGRVFLQKAGETEMYLLEEPYLSEKNVDRTRSLLDKFVIPEGHYLVFGDNRNHSQDSRQCFGFVCDEEHTPYVAQKNIVGRAELVLWPAWEMRWLQGGDD